MNLESISVWGLVATVVMTTIMAGALPLGLSRVSIPFILGTMVTPDRSRANLIGFVAQVIIGWVLALLYALAFDRWHEARWWIGAILGLIHGLFLLMVIMPLLPGAHPRMATETRGPEPTRELEPPGFMACHYGQWTPLVVVFAHIVYGTILGAFYHIAPR